MESRKAAVFSRPRLGLGYHILTGKNRLETLFLYRHASIKAGVLNTLLDIRMKIKICKFHTILSIAFLYWQQQDSASFLKRGPKCPGQTAHRGLPVVPPQVLTGAVHSLHDLIKTDRVAAVGLQGIDG